jgi:malate/lactate dehydrogenase
VTLEGEFDVRGRAAAMPVQLGPIGVRRIVAPALTARERVSLDIAIGA